MSNLYDPVIISILSIICLFPLAGTHAQMAKSQLDEFPAIEAEWQDTIPGAWGDIDLTGSDAKVMTSVEKGGFPIWIPIAAVAAGTGAYFLLRDNDDDPEFMLMDDQVAVSCQSSASFDPTANDVGTGLMVLSAENPPEATVSVDGPNSVSISDINTSFNFNFNITIRDESGQTGMSTVFVNVSAPDIEAIDDAFSTVQEEGATLSVLNNDIGPDIRIIDFTQPSDGVVGILPSDAFTFQPNAGFSGTTSFTYTIEGPCGLTSTANVTITVIGNDCGIDVNVTETPASCGSEDGAAEITVSPAGSFNYSWSNGLTGPNQMNLGEGTYTVSISNSGQNCLETVDVVIEEEDLDLDVTTDITPSNCGSDNGSASIEINTPGEYEYDWSNGATGPQASDLPAGNYQVTITSTGTDCRQIVTLVINEIEPDIEATFDVDDALCSMPSGSATINVEPTGNYGYEWSNGSTGDQITDVEPGDYTVTVTLDGTSCEKEFSVQVGNQPPEFDAIITPTDADCGLANGAIEVNTLPQGTYTYNWSNGAMTEDIDNLSPGTYRLSVTDQQGCERTYNITVNEADPDYIVDLNTSGGNCLGEGSVVDLTTQTPGAGPILVTISGPEGSQTLTVPVGQVSLADSLTFVPGNYTLSVSDQSIGGNCEETQSFALAENSDFALQDDMYETFVNFVVNGNLFDNDTGPGLEITFFTQPNSGNLILNDAGFFTYIPPNDTTANVSFQYEAEDACGNTGTAIVTIMVVEPPCDFQTGVIPTNPNCGLPDGEIEILVDPPGNYSFEWSDDSTGSNRTGLLAGEYTVTVTNNDDGCSIDFTVLLEDLPPAHISNLLVGQPVCQTPGTILFEVNTEGPGQFVLEFDGPGGSGQETLSEGEVILDDYTEIIPGMYTIYVYDVLAGPACTDSIEVVIEEPDIPVIQVGSVIQPSGPNAIDGSITVNIINETEIPYFITVNGSPMGATAQNSFTLENLGVGDYAIQVSDGTGCPSDTIDVTLSAGPQNLTVSMSATTMRPPGSDGTVEHPPVEGLNKVALAVSLRWTHDLGKVPSITQLSYVQGASYELPDGGSTNVTPGNGIYRPPLSGSYFVLDQMVRFVDLDVKGLDFSLAGGASAGLLIGKETSLYPQWVIEADLQYRVSNFMTTFFNARMNGLDEIYAPAVSGGLRVKVGKN